MPSVSIITPVYNARDFLRATYESVLSQTYSDWEWILVDDCSTDGSYDYMKDNFTDQRITVLQNEKNCGAGYTRNVAIRKATGRFLAFLDADDVWLKNKLAKQLAFMKAENAPISHTAYAYINEKGGGRSGKMVVKRKVDIRTYMCTTEISCNTAMIDRCAVTRVRFVNSRTREDTALWISLLDKGFCSYGLNEILSFYRISPQQTTRPSQLTRLVYQTLTIYCKSKVVPKYKIFLFWIRYIANAVFKRIRTS